MKKLMTLVLAIAVMFSFAILLSSCDMQGQQGIQGEKGDQGIQGEKGDQGIQGERGDQGIQGEQGQTGATIAKVEYDEQGRLVITLSDGTVLDPVDPPKANGTDGLEYYPLPDDTYGVKAGTTKYLSEIEIPATYNGKPVTQILPEAFSSATNLTSITIPDSVTSIGYYAFRDCTSLTSVVIGEGVTSIGDAAFSNCTSLSSVVIGDSVTSIGNLAFDDCSSLTSVVIGEGVTSIGGWAFQSCSSLTSVVIGDSVTSIGNYAFCACTSLTSVVIPDSVTSIGSGAFSGCNTIVVETGNQNYHVSGNCLIETESKTLLWGTDTSVIPTDGSVTSIGDYAFYDCTSLSSVVIPDSVTSIGNSAFFNCNPALYTTYEFGKYVGIGDNPYAV